jgi:hypothetical protein
LPAATGLCSYLAKYAAYEPLLTMNVEAYVEVLAAKGTELGLADISREVATHSAELAHMEEHLLPTVCLGLVQVNCMKVCVGGTTLSRLLLLVLQSEV